MTEAEVNKAVDALTVSLKEVKPIIQEDYPHLLR
jgi:hypothetical protein